MVAYGKAHVAEAVIDVDRVRTEGTVHPQWRRRGVGTALMHWLIGRAAELHAVKHPNGPGRHERDQHEHRSAPLAAT
jgi:mycothiol synthase